MKSLLTTCALTLVYERRIIAMILLLLLVTVTLFGFNAISDKNISIPWNQPFFWLGIFAFTILTGEFKKTGAAVEMAESDYSITSTLGWILLTVLTVSFQAVKAALMSPVKSLRSD